MNETLPTATEGRLSSTVYNRLDHRRLHRVVPRRRPAAGVTGHELVGLLPKGLNERTQ
jgi:hypothetical protein